MGFQDKNTWQPCCRKSARGTRKCMRQEPKVQQVTEGGKNNFFLSTPQQIVDPRNVSDRAHSFSGESYDNE